MTSTQAILGRIAALRQRLAQPEGQIRAAASAGSGPEPNPSPLQTLERQVAAGSWKNALIDSSVRQVPGVVAPAAAPNPPMRLTARSSRLLQRGRDLLHELRRLADEPVIANSPLDALARLHREAAAMIDSVLRAVQVFPRAPSEQVRLCDGLEAVLTVVAERVGALQTGLEHRARRDAKVNTLVDLMQALVRGQSVTLHAFYPLAEELLEEARLSAPLHFFQGDPQRPDQFIACHSLVVAQVIARLARTDPEWTGRAHEPVVAALVHDIGMLTIPGQVLAQASPLRDDQRRLIEGHPAAAAEILRNLVPCKSWILEAAAAHHERIDGTGYPAGLRGDSLPALVRLLTVCDIYAALCSARPYRPALETRTALTDTLLLAEQRAIDQHHAERLLDLSFYPAGSVVELTDGAVGMVLAAHPAHKDVRAPARPVLAMLTDSQARLLPLPSTLDLAQCQERSILRTLAADERQGLIGTRYPELV